MGSNLQKGRYEVKTVIELDNEVLPYLIVTATRAVCELRRTTNPADHTRGAQDDRHHAMLLEDAVEALKVAYK